MRLGRIPVGDNTEVQILSLALYAEATACTQVKHQAGVAKLGQRRRNEVPVL